MTKPRHKTKVQNTPPPNGVHQNTLLFSMYTPTPAVAGAPPRYTSRHCPISQRHRVSSATEKALFSFLCFFVCSGDDYIPVDAARRFLRVLGAARVS